MKRIFLFLAVLFLLSEPSNAQNQENTRPADTQKPKDEQEALKIKKEQEAARIRKIFDGIYERNRTVKKSPEWLKEAYSGLKIKKLNDIPKEEYKSYSQYVRNKEAFIIVHPGYYAFFEDMTVLTGETCAGDFPCNNVVELFSYLPADKLPVSGSNMEVMLEQERLLRDFLEFMSVEKKLVILILPRDYKNNLSHGYKEGRDEYARYLSELTNGSDSIIYIESRTHSSGYMGKEDMELLSSFLKNADVRRIMLGGGYLGKCLDEFHESLTGKFSYDNVYFVPELMTLSPREMLAESMKLLTQDSRINFRGVIRYLYINGAATNNPKGIPNFKRFSLYGVYR